ncbi:MAG TPA: hypothetical protein VK589_25385 [Chryseolinea sp.]|nr:hypothetical protein [Chryseolinea sp.]
MVTGIAAMTCSEAIEEIPIPSGNNPPPGTEAISDKDRHKVLGECAAFVDLLGDLRSEVAQQTLVQWLNTRPEFEAAGILENNVWAYFNDGRLAMFIPNWEGAEEEGGRLAMEEGSRVNNSLPSPTGRTQGVPKTNTVTLFHGLGKAFIEDRQFLKELFAKSKTNYTVDLKDASIENLKAVKDLGIFYIRTHGGSGLEKPKKDSSRVFALSTTNLETEENDKIYKDELDEFRLAYCFVVHDVPGKAEWHYGITKAFVYEYMSFAENAFLFIDACNSTRENAMSFKDIMMWKAGNREATYIGWTKPKSQVAGTPTARYIFDRLLGAHDSAVPMEDPVQRPFDVAAIFEDLKSFNLGESTSGGKITHYTTVETKPILTPSIEYIDMVDSYSEMRIKGLFGENPGKTDGIVTVDGVAVPWDEWSEDLIVCTLPDTGPGSSGDVIVSVRGNKSNVVPLSEWTIPINLSKDEIGMTTEAILNLRLRADIHSYRSKPGESPKPPRVDPILSMAGQPFSIGSKGTYSVGGQTRITCKSAGCDVKDNRNVAARSGQLPYRLGSTPELGFTAFYKWSSDMKKLSITLDVNIPNVGIQLENITICPGIAPVTVPSSMETMFGIHHYDFPQDPVARLELTLDDKFTIQSGKKTKTMPLPSLGLDCTGTLQMVTTAQWSSSVAAFAPKEDTEAGDGND